MTGREREDILECMSEQPHQPEKKKTYSKEDILLAENPGEVLNNYRKAFESIRRSEERVGLQNAVADRLHELGDEEGSMKFTILAGESQNAAQMENAAKIFGEAQYEASIKMGRFSESFENAGTKMSNSARAITEASEKISSASYRMSDNRG